MHNWLLVSSSLAVALSVLLSAMPGGRPQSESVSLVSPGAAVLDSRPDAGTSGQGIAPFLPEVSVCRVPRNEGQIPEPSSELRLARDAQGNYWQIQSGCRHRVVPQSMDPVALRAIPQGEDITTVTYIVSAPVPTPSPLSMPAYSQVPAAFLPSSGAPPVVPAVAEATLPPSPGFLQGYAGRVLVSDPDDPSAVYLLDGGMRHLVVVYYPLCAVYPRELPICQPVDEPLALDLSRGGDPTIATPFPYLLRRSPTADCVALYPGLRLLPEQEVRNCAVLYEQFYLQSDRARGLPRDTARELALQQARRTSGFVANIEEIPLGQPAPYYGWGRGDSTVISERPRLPDAVNCAATGGQCSGRFNDAQVVALTQFVKDQSRYYGSDVRITGVACNVRYNRMNNVTTLSLREDESSVPAAAPGIRAALDPDMADNVRLSVGGSVSPAGELVIFEYRRVGTGICRNT